ncbi:hypothetical protein TRFO_33950 [Tritrichomonas foetus]|uniref:F5/8 type C domain-containing protein n=1 Tax=Tritrichomonas foetus TaxID=1144522 RepID=A0A1J4JPX9_9EUKA|nr:hypothetical protein TRFO_33950 [Tritrichomonas foetus]|eukprot:OHS99579.1 hypothetical protein TRFO_33950 [Tritrichomonas foetus]
MDYNNNYTGESYYSINKKNSYVCFDFKNHQISLINYSLKTSDDILSPFHLRSWKIEGSNDRRKWKKLDSHSNDKTFSFPNQIHTFEIKDGNRPKSRFRFIRL